MNNDSNEKRLKVLEDHINNDLDLLKEYEDVLRDETDPRRKAKYRREIEQQRESLAHYQQEYNQLREHVAPEYAQNIADLLQQKDAKLEEVQKFLPQVWNVPHHRNPNFTGREDILADLRLSLTSGEPAAWKQAVTGMGGVGKTQLVVEYIYRHKTDYRVIWWIRSEEPAAMAADYADLAVDLDLPENASPDQTEITKAVKHWLEHNSGWLLIFDNARDQKDVRDYLPKGGAGHLIITSRNPDWSGVAKMLSVQVFDRDESIDFLCKRAGQDDKKAADALADELGDLPLALEQAGAYIETTGITLIDYQELFQSRRKELWDDETPPPDYPDSVATTWSLAMEQVSKESPVAADLLNLCAFLAPDEISLEMLSGGTEHLPEPLATTATDRLAMNRAIKVLKRYSLIDADGENLSVHRLVQAVVRDRLSEDDEKRWAETAVALLSAAFPFYSDDTRTWHQCSRLLPHALAAADHAEVREVAPEKTSQILNQTGLYLCGRAEFAEAKANCERALNIAEKVYGLNHADVTIHVNNLGLILRDMGNLQGAKGLFERGLKINENTYGPYHPDIATNVNNLGLVLLDMGNLQGAREQFERALKIDENTYGPDHPVIATNVNNLGLVLRNMGNVQGAREHYERALKIDENTYGPDHPNVATIVNNLGLVLQSLGDIQGAKEQFERALKIDENTYGPDHPDVARDVNNLGSVLRDMGNLQGAREHYKRALKIYENKYGPDHPNVGRVINNLGSVLRNMGDVQGAREHYERALEIFCKFLGEEHPLTVIVRKNLEWLAYLQGRGIKIITG
ncbi:MAG: Photosystem I assembly protein Ycf3 [ANME-2 cluster archaeon]|nr:Photosystem I assembly protein Ycf3 [ANME-2 cluster archaeon]